MRDIVVEFRNIVMKDDEAEKRKNQKTIQTSLRSSVLTLEEVSTFQQSS